MKRSDNSGSIIFMGSPDFAVPSLEALYRSGIKIKAVVTQPDKKRGRGRKLSYTPVKEKALELGLEVLQPEKMKDPDFIERLFQLNADLFVVVAFRILPRKILKIPPLGSVNLHASLLPSYRGAAPINHVLFNGDKKTGMTVFFLNSKKVDSGKIIDQLSLEIEDSDNFGSLYNKLKIRGSEFLPDVVKNIFKGQFTLTEQNTENVKYLNAPKIFRDDFRINWNTDAEDIHNRIRGLSPKPGAFFKFKSKNYKIIKSSFSNEVTDSVPGKILISDVKKGLLKIAAEKGAVFPEEIQPEGKGIMDVRSFLNGTELKTGDIVDNG